MIHAPSHREKRPPGGNRTGVGNFVSDNPQQWLRADAYFTTLLVAVNAARRGNIRC